MDVAARQLLKAVRGKRSQKALSRRLGYRGNPVANWETGRRFPTAQEFLRVCKASGIDVQACFERFLRAPAATRSVEADLIGWLNDLRGTSSIAAISLRLGRSRFAVRRWLAGTTQPRLPAFLSLVEAITGRVSDLVAELVPISQVPSLEHTHRARQAARSTAFSEPWTEAVLRVLETSSGRRQSTAEWVSHQLSIERDVARRCLDALEVAGLIAAEDGGYRNVGALTVDTKGTPEVMRKVTEHWTRIALERIGHDMPRNLFAYNVFCASAEDIEAIRSAIRACFRQIRTIVSASAASEVVGVVNLQLAVLSGGDERSQ